MKRTAAALLALIMVLGVTGCGKKKESNNDESSAADTVVTDAEDSMGDVIDIVQPEPETTENKLDENSPIPSYNGGVSLTEQTFELENLTLKLPQGVTAQDNETNVTVLAADGRWRLTFTPVDYETETDLRATVENDLNGSLANAVYGDIDSAETKLAGFDTKVYAKNIFDKWYNANSAYYQSVDIFMDYGSELAGQWNGMYIKLDAAGYESNQNIYDLLRDDEVRAILNSFDIIKEDYGQFMSVGGITATFPSRWNMITTSYLGPIASFKDSSGSGSVYIFTMAGTDPAAAAAGVSEDTFELTYGDRTYTCAYREVGGSEDETGMLYLDMFTEFSDTRVMYISLFLADGDKDSLLEFAKGSMFTSVAESVKTDPTQFFEEKATPVNNYACDSYGVITAYSGSNIDVKVPEKIGDVYVTGIASGAFKDNDAIVSVELPEGLRFVSDSAFSGCVNLSKLNLGSSVSYIGNYAFSGCSALDEAVIPKSVSMLGIGAFTGTGKGGTFTAEGGLLLSEDALSMTGFNTITLAGGSDISASGVFRSSAASKIDPGSGYTEIGDSCFEDCVNLKEVTIPASVTSIGSAAFAGADSLTRVTLPPAVQTLGVQAFANCDSLTTVILPEGITEIPEGCFDGTKLHTIIVPSSVKTIKENAFGEGTKYVCLMNAKDITLEDDAINCSMLYFNDVYETDDAPANLKNQTIVSQVLLPADATIAQTESFDKYLKKIDLGEISWIGIQPEYLARDYYLYQQDNGTITGFSGNTSELRIPFYGNNLDQILIVGEGAFADSNFTAVYFTGEITTIRANAFSGSDQLMDMWFTTTAIKLTKDGALSGTSFDGLPDDITVHLPATLSDADRSDIEDAFHDAGLSESATFDYYTL